VGVKDVGKGFDADTMLFLKGNKGSAERTPEREGTSDAYVRTCRPESLGLGNVRRGGE